MSLTAPHTWLSRAAALALIVVVGGAAWAFADRSGDPASATGRPVTSPAELSRRLPFHSLLYAQTDAQVDIARAKRQLTITCMTRLGFHYEPVPIPDAAESTEGHQTPFGLESVTGAASDPTEAAPSESPVSRAFTLALYGHADERISAKGKLIKISIPGSGCQAEAEKKLLGDQRLRWLQLKVELSEAEQETRKQLEKDREFHTANARWRQCMHAAGLTHQDPVSLLYDIPRGTDLSTSPAAYADVRCKGETDYFSTAYARLGTVQQTWLDQHASILTDWTSLLRRQETAARAVLGGRG